jgi:hypothetical protein
MDGYRGLVAEMAGLFPTNLRVLEHWKRGDLSRQISLDYDDQRDNLLRYQYVKLWATVPGDPFC